MTEHIFQPRSSSKIYILLEVLNFESNIFSTINGNSASIYNKSDVIHGNIKDRYKDKPMTTK